MDGDEIGDDEEIVRAVPFPKFDAKKGIVRYDVFIDRDGVSVGRTAVLPYDALREIFISDLHRPPDKPLTATVAITVGKLKSAVGTPPADPPATAIVVVDEVKDVAGVTDNPAHALIFGIVAEQRKQLSPGQAKRVLAAADAARFIEWPDEPVEAPQQSSPPPAASGA